MGEFLSPSRARLLRAHVDRTPTHGYESTREAAMTVLAKGWRARVRLFRKTLCDFLITSIDLGCL
jgi:hypothetical protein